MKKQDEASYLCTAGDEAQAGLLAGMLENAGIPYVIRHVGAGPLYGSAALFGVKLYVASDRIDQAKEIVEAYASQAQDEDDSDVY